MSKKKRKTEPPMEVNLPITPMLDMTFQLLFFFVVQFNPNTAFEGHMALALPSEQSKQAKDQSKADPLNPTNPDKAVEFKSDVTVHVHSDDADRGDGFRVTVKDSSGKEESFEQNLQKLQAHLEELRKTAGEKDSIKVEGDGKLRWGKMVAVMDACRKSGFENVSFAPPG